MLFIRQSQNGWKTIFASALFFLDESEDDLLETSSFETIVNTFPEIPKKLLFGEEHPNKTFHQILKSTRIKRTILVKLQNEYVKNGMMTASTLK